MMCYEIWVRTSWIAALFQPLTRAREYLQPAKDLEAGHIWEALDAASEQAGIGHVSSHVFRHTYRTWLDSTGSPIGIQKQLMRHSDIRTTMNIYGSAISDDMRQALAKVAALALPKSLN